MSVRKQALKYTAAALAVAALVIVASTLYINPAVTNVGRAGGTPSRLIIQLTDPPTVPQHTSSLNLTYSSISLMVGEPGSDGQQTLTTKVVTPTGGSATLDLLRLQNVSQTIALASLPNGSTIYSFAFMVTSIKIDVNGTVSSVTLAGGSTLTVTLARPAMISGDDVALLRLNPVIVLTPSGYQMIPSAVGIVRPESQGDQNEQEVGFQQQLSTQDEDQLDQARGNVTATLSALSVSGNSTSITVQVKNTGNTTVALNAIGVHGNFTATQTGQAASCASSETQSSTESGSGDQSTTSLSTTTTSTSTTTTTSSECGMEHADEVVFVPVNSTVSGTSCVSLKMQLVNGDMGENGDHGLTLTKGQCVNLTFSGVISFGESGFALVPSTSSGQVYFVHVIASEGANVDLSCKLPVTATSCSVSNQEEG
ncbi:MAG: hypothetical protein KGI38_01425 [Thaumarchaeota archaeon]|nr:hypothetical protein [Nitrososphaerota archaeon]